MNPNVELVRWLVFFGWLLLFTWVAGPAVVDWIRRRS